MENNIEQDTSDMNPYRLSETKLEAYKIAIQARENLRKDYSTWMNFYYIANGALLVALTGERVLNESTQTLLAFIGLFVSVSWYWSCRGHRYWADNWLRLIINLEMECFGEKKVFGVFAKETKDDCKFLGKSNISTPKIIHIVSVIISMVWLCYIFSLGDCNISVNISNEILGMLLLVVMLFVYPKMITSKGNLHKNIDTKKIEEK
ncbi:MAG: hypothetical protein Q4C75_04715 [Bergeyella zoohelcum]|nr:hypothetical protein [Bergeyella zoohelcum]